MNALHGLLIGALLATGSAVFCPAQAVAPADAQQSSVNRECAHLSMRAAAQALDDANRFFKSGDAKAAHGAIDAVLSNARRSVECALIDRKHIKNEEIDLRELLRRLKDFSGTLDLADQPHVSQVRATLEMDHDRLLYAIFGDALGGKVAENQP